MAKPTDPGRQEADALLQTFEDRVKWEYRQASYDAYHKVADWLKQFKKKDAEYRALMDAGQMDAKDYYKWRKSEIMKGRQWADMRDTLAEDYSNVNDIVRRLNGDLVKDVYAVGRNYGAYEIEHGTNLDLSYTLYNREAVERLMRDDPTLLPPPGKKASEDIAAGRTKAWNRRQVQSIMTQSLLQGDSIDHIAQRIVTGLGEKNMHAAVRTARTMTTEAESAGRVASYKRAKDMGIDVMQIWVATLDDRTRHEHRQLDGERCAVGGKFKIDGYELEYPGDPSAPGYLVYNCRCAVIAAVKGTELYENFAGVERDNRLGDMSYEEWKNEKAKMSEHELQPEISAYVRTEADEKYMANLATERTTVESMKPMQQAAYLFKHEAGAKNDLLEAGKNGTISNYTERYFDALESNGSTVSHKPLIEQPQLSGDIDSNTERLHIVRELTGASDEDSEQMYRAVRTWTSNAWDTADTALVDRYIDADGTFDGELWRGLHFDTEDERDSFLAGMQVGNVFQAGRDGKNASWSSKKVNAETFSNAGAHSVIIHCVGNKSAAPIDYMNLQGEQEVVSRSGTRYTVLGISQEAGEDRSRTIITVIEKEPEK